MEELKYCLLGNHKAPIKDFKSNGTDSRGNVRYDSRCKVCYAAYIKDRRKALNGIESSAKEMLSPDQIALRRYIKHYDKIEREKKELNKELDSCTNKGEAGLIQRYLVQLREKSQSMFLEIERLKALGVSLPTKRAPYSKKIEERYTKNKLNKVLKLLQNDNPQDKPALESEKRRLEAKLFRLQNPIKS